MQSSDGRLHLAIIPDGNRRWAKRQLLKPWDGHRRGMDNGRDLVRWCRENPRIHTLTLWGFSTENWNRPTEEIRVLMNIYETYLLQERETFIANKTRLIHSGRKDRLPQTLVQLLNDVSEETAEDYEFTLNFALDYGGRDEIVRAVQRLAVRQPAMAGSVNGSFGEPLPNISDEHLRQCFDHPELPDMDLVIRTSGEMRTSGFFIWQTAYAEWHFNNKYFPDLKPEDVDQAIKDYDNRERRFGK